MEKFLTILTVAILVEAIWENLKMIWQEGKLNIDRIGSLIVSILVALFTKINVFSVLGISINIYVGSVLTGIVISRGANFFHDLLTKISQLNTNGGDVK